MNTEKPKTAQYTIQIISPSAVSNLENKTKYVLREKGAMMSQEFNSPELLLQKIETLGQDSSSFNAKEVVNKGAITSPQLADEVELLKILLKASHFKLRKLRFAMTDRITSAMTRVTMLKAGHQSNTSVSEEKWLNESLSDLEQLSQAIDDWTRVCETLDPNDLNSIEAIKLMVVKLIRLEKFDFDKELKNVNSIQTSMAKDISHCCHTA